MCACVLQDSLDELEMDDYWKEVENISRSGGGGAGRGDGGGEGEVPEEEQQKIPEGRRRRVYGLRADTQISHAHHGDMCYSLFK